VPVTLGGGRQATAGLFIDLQAKGFGSDYSGPAQLQEFGF
jgi:hypothetical protein